MATNDLSALDPGFRSKLEQLYGVLRGQGYDPTIGSGWRSLDEQAQLKAKGYSQVSFSFHNAVNASGQPAALAVDVIDRRLGWSKDTAEHVAFLRALGAAAKAIGLHWGGDWSQSNPTWAKYGIGWDPHHVQMYSNSALGQVRQQSEAVWAAVQSGNPLTVASTAARGYLEVLKALPWYWWAAIAGAGGLLLLLLILRRKRRIARTP